MITSDTVTCDICDRETDDWVVGPASIINCPECWQELLGQCPDLGGNTRLVIDEPDQARPNWHYEEDI